MPFDGTAYQSDTALGKLEQLIELLADPDRWCKGQLRSRDGRYCVMGAVNEVGGAEALQRPILQAVRMTTGRRYWSIESFNDDRATTHASVCMVLHRAREIMIFDGSRERMPGSWKASLREWFTARLGLRSPAG
jgi:hypothetical protein